MKIINTGHLREIAEQVDTKLHTKGKIARATESFINKSGAFWTKVFSFIRMHSSRRHPSVESVGKTSPFLHVSGGFELTSANVISFKETFQEYGPKNIVKQLTPSEINKLMGSDFLNFGEKLQILEAYRGDKKAPTDSLISNLCIKTKELHFPDGTFVHSPKNPKVFAEQIISFFVETSVEELPLVIDFYFGINGLFPLPDLPKSYQDALQVSLSEIQENLRKLIPTKSQTKPTKEDFQSAGQKMVQLLGLKYALDFLSGNRQKSSIEETITVIKHNYREDQTTSLLRSTNYDKFTKGCLNYLNGSTPDEIHPGIFDEISSIFEVSTTKTSHTEKILASWLRSEFDSGKTIKHLNTELNEDTLNGIYEKLLCLLQSQDPKERSNGIEELIGFSMENNLDPISILSLYPKTTFELLKSKIEELRDGRIEGKTCEGLYEKIRSLSAYTTKIFNGDASRRIPEPLRNLLQKITISLRPSIEDIEINEAIAAFEPLYKKEHWDL